MGKKYKSSECKQLHKREGIFTGNNENSEIGYLLKEERIEMMRSGLRNVLEAAFWCGGRGPGCTSHRRLHGWLHSPHLCTSSSRRFSSVWRWSRLHSCLWSLLMSDDHSKQLTNRCQQQKGVSGAVNYEHVVYSKHKLCFWSLLEHLIFIWPT